MTIEFYQCNSAVTEVHFICKQYAKEEEEHPARQMARQ